MISLCAVYLIASFLTASHAAGFSRRYTEKLEFDNKKSSNELVGRYEARSLSECAMMCQKDCDLFGYNSKLKKCRTHKKIFTSGMSNETGWRYYFPEFLPLDCKDLRENSYINSGVYDIYPYGTKSLPVGVYCDMETMDGGWTVIQKRLDGSVSFNRTWTDYKNGFGAKEKNVWIGNDVIHQLTRGENSYLYVSVTLQNDTKLYELYDRFSVSNESENYQLFLAGNATGTLGDAMLSTGSSNNDLSGMYFTTPDKDNDRALGANCAVTWGGGWWFNYCHLAFLNGPWYPKSWQYP
ncbi:fibroleukin-like [Saccostrea echinata]|uniref:fibroleukin-like n=1 Tax=Saccostrea echinata TaxID=191078 RepID=UPI002A82D0E4|nr:fibroleukin-like [Saccostrea echinata]